MRNVATSVYLVLVVPIIFVLVIAVGEHDNVTHATYPNEVLVEKRTVSRYVAKIPPSPSSIHQYLRSSVHKCLQLNVIPDRYFEEGGDYFIITGDHSKQDQALLVQIAKYILVRGRSLCAP